MFEKVWDYDLRPDVGLRGGLACAALFLIFAVTTRIGSDFLSTMTAMFQPLPAISLLPLAMLWFGLGIPSLVFVTIHSVLWAVALSTHVGFMGVSETMRMVGRNYGLKGIPYIFKILVPAAFSSILTGLKIGWAFAWRTLIGAELVFGAAAGKGGLGWMIFEKGDNLDTPYVFCRLVHGHRRWPRRREPHFQKYRDQHDRQMGHAALTNCCTATDATLAHHAEAFSSRTALVPTHPAAGVPAMACEFRSCVRAPGPSEALKA